MSGYAAGMRRRSLQRVLERAKPVEAPLAVGSRVVVGPAVPACVAYIVEGRAVPAREEERDGREGEGAVEALDIEYARVRLDSGQVVAGVRRSRMRRA